ncbi:MAG: hypothetical protein GEU80_02995 [Dehalococcoidia bacterium]|nr:hypothetical protein [Dehalococcoidia bacterium]
MADRDAIHHCGGRLHEALVAYGIGPRDGMTIVLQVPGRRCERCDAELISAEDARHLDEIVFDSAPYDDYVAEESPTSAVGVVAEASNSAETLYLVRTP